MVDIAESIEDVRGIERRSGRMVLLMKGVEAVRTGDAGGELPRDLDKGTGEETLRSWWYEPVFAGALAGPILEPKSVELIIDPSLPDVSVPMNPSKPSLGDVGRSWIASVGERGECGEECELDAG